MPLISVVVPTYNSEKYISHTIESIINQSFEDWEIIIVDDCSNDNTYNIIKTYSSRDKRIKIHRLEKNTGSAYIPRKIGIQLSNSNNILTLDSDDYLDTDYIEKIYNRKLETGTKIVLGRFISVTDDGKVLEECLPNNDFDFNILLSGNEAVKKTIGTWEIFCNGGLISKDVYLSAWDKFGSDYYGINADELFSRQLLISVDYVSFCKVNYFYRINPDSITRKFSVKKIDVIKTNRLLKDFAVRYIENNKIELEKIEHQRWRSLLTCTILLIENKEKIEDSVFIEKFNIVKNEWYDINWKIIPHKSIIDAIIPIARVNFNVYLTFIKIWIHVRFFKKL